MTAIGMNPAIVRHRFQVWNCARLSDPISQTNGEGVTGVDPKAGAIFHDPSLAIREAVNGGGVALADNIMAEDLLAKGLLVAPFPIRRRIPNFYCLAERSGASSLLGVKQFRQWLFAEVGRHKRAMKLT